MLLSFWVSSVKERKTSEWALQMVTQNFLLTLCSRYNVCYLTCGRAIESRVLNLLSLSLNPPPSWLCHYSVLFNFFKHQFPICRVGTVKQVSESCDEIK